MSITFYTAGKIWHAPKFQMLRDMGWPVNSRWIDLDPVADEHFITHQKDKLWQLCLEDVCNSSFLLLYCEDMQEEQRGALVEIGMAMAFGKPIYVVGRCKTVVAHESSDVAFTHHNLWTWVDSSDLIRGTALAIALYIERVKQQQKRKVA